MRANAPSTSPSQATLPTLDDVERGRISLDDYERALSEDIPELTGDTQAQPVKGAAGIAEVLEKSRGQRGPQKDPVKERVGLRLDPAVVEHFRRTGPGWQGRINAVLAAHVKANEES